MPPTSLERSALVMWGGWFKLQLEIRHTTAPTTGAKHWHRQKAVFYVFVLVTLTCQKDGCKPKNRPFGLRFVSDALIHLQCCLHRNIPKTCPYVMTQICALTYVIYGGIAFSIGWCLSPRGGFSRCAFPRGSLGACLASGRRVSAPPVGPLPRHAAPRW